MIHVWICPHTDRKYRAKGRCNACYLKYNGGGRRWYQQNKQLTIQRAQKWVSDNPAKRRIVARRWAKKDYATDPEKWKQEVYHRYKTNLNYRISWHLRARIRVVLKKNKKIDTTIHLIGCSVGELRKHLESQFQGGMLWENYGRYGWHIDHIRPCASFDLSDPEQQKACFHYTNLQPLWAFDNLSKGAK